jgi:trimethylamine--corrinoid protein Co-methyltransferase
MSYTPNLARDEAEKIHASSLQVLEHTGIRTEHDEAAALLLDAGAVRDGEDRILIPARLVEEAREKARAASSEIQIYDRDGEPAMLLRNGDTYFGPGSDALEIRDLDTDEIRPATAADVGTNVIVADAVGMDFVMTMALPRDLPHVYPTLYFEMVKHTTRPTVVTAADFDSLVQTYRIAEMIAGGEERLRHKPTLVAYVEPISPLHLDEDGTDKLIFLAERGYPCLYAAGANCAATAPVTIEGAVSQANAEFLAGMVVATLKNEHVPMVSGASCSSMDMRTSGVCYGSPEWGRTVAMFAGMGEYYGLPSWGFAGGSDAVEPDFQAGMEAYESVLLALQSGSTLVHDVAYLKRGYLYDPRMLVLTKMMIDRARQLLRPLRLDEESLAGSVIDDVARRRDGIDNFLSHTHTFEHFRDALWIPPRYWERGANHTRSLPERLTEVTKDIIATHQPPPLPDTTTAEVESFLRSL